MNTTTLRDRTISYRDQSSVIVRRDKVMLEAMIFKHPKYRHGNIGGAWDEIVQKVNAIEFDDGKVGLSTIKDQYRARKNQERQMTDTNERHIKVDNLLYQLISLRARHEYIRPAYQQRQQAADPGEGFSTFWLEQTFVCMNSVMHVLKGFHGNLFNIVDRVGDNDVLLVIERLEQKFNERMTRLEEDLVTSQLRIEESIIRLFSQ
ncbi:hypothetical protein PHYBLDRAFT_139429 [Phycomyces blakesleeanus NRRL 1555(-)]|uniref:Uncharacterized protein n=1 Tax=Phycomyces blakesleeanus (strain ATCC 8743b / DSM 1359 / FGSC 10004 / NBRC 33097 / NRRL 1555) TaxID=763407 RepID=A0A167QB21_PHYB8|nr:hypothetical protein PHYBLDRAFT_139429 [Phycomyces blakesleeanus NRRL 1555(-)]OAD79398.1 hypothetical protein PHYBLDRAFT_139429 [Phycomyces blakesleeanus NRRL 1555(-)]|eukprot:XP_018297438.1 hypothetical protein PHYBLDRAFT_139429 [Phycomyces blakesleeanus NRRL 1555(-)]